MFILNLDIIINVLTIWVEIDELTYLDTSYCNIIDRPVYLKIISGPNFTHKTENLNSKRDYLEWLALRSLKLEDLNLEIYEKRRVDAHVKVILECKRLRHLKMKCCSNLLRFVTNSCSNIQSLDLSDSGCFLDDGIFQFLLKKLTGLSAINLTNCHRLTDESTKILVDLFPGLTAFSNVGCFGMTSDSYELLAMNCTRLTKLIPQDYFLHLILVAERCPLVTHLNLAECQFITDNGLIKVAEHCKFLQYLNIKDSEMITDIGVCAITLGCQMLQHLNMNLCVITDRALIAVATRCPLVTHLKVQRCVMLTNVGFLSIATHLKKLQFLNVSRCPAVDDATVRIFAKHCAQLVRINLARCGSVTNESVSELLAACKYLEYTNLYATHTTDKCLITAGFQDLHCVNFLKGAVLVNILKNGKRSLTYSRISRQSFNTSALNALVMSSPNLQELHLVKFNSLSDQELINLVDILPQLRTVRLTSNAKLTSACVRHIANTCHFLTVLEVGDMSSLNDDVLTYVVTTRPHITGLYVRNCERITDISILAVGSQCMDLKLLLVVNCDEVSDLSILVVIVNCVKLCDFTIKGLYVTDVILDEIAQSGSNIRHADISGCPLISQTAIDAFQRVNGYGLKSFVTKK